MIQIIALLLFLAIHSPLYSQNPKAVIRTELGDITVEVFIQQAPISAGNFLNYVDDRLYADAVFYRVVTLENQPNE